MRAALLPAPGTALRVVDLDLDEPRPGEVRVRLHAAGVCSDDLNVLDGTVEVPCPVVPGHEGAGVVEALGAGVVGLALGDHVALSWAPDAVEVVATEGVRALGVHGGFGRDGPRPRKHPRSAPRRFGFTETSP